MLRLFLLATLLSSAIVPADGSANLRVMRPVELATSSTIIARARVLSVDESEWGNFRQIARLELVDVIEGDFTIKEVRVAAQSLVAYTDDRYAKKEEWLVFLWHDAGFYRTVNYQYGQFRIENEVVRGWRNAENVASDRPYYSVREEIEQILAGIKAPAAEEPQSAVPPSQVQQAPPAARPRPSSNRPPPTVIRPEQP